MNIEKSIEILKALRNYNKFYKEENTDLTITITLEAKESIDKAIESIDKAIERLLTAYEKEKEKNESLIKERATEIVYVDKNFVRKDKIKAKIEELDKQEKEEPDAFLCKRVLQSLLEKEGE